MKNYMIKNYIKEISALFLKYGLTQMVAIDEMSHDKE